MTQEDKELLLKDLCARLPYGVMIEGLEHPEVMTIKHLAIISVMPAEPYKPYLRPMSSITDDEWKDYQKIRMTDWVHGDINGTFINAGLIVNWLLEHHFDYRGLIEKGLAIEVTENNNPYKE